MDIAELQKLAGINEYNGYTEYSLENISDAANANKKKEREKNIRPGDKEWFELWFGLPKMTGENMPAKFRGRTKK